MLQEIPSDQYYQCQRKTCIVREPTILRVLSRDDLKLEELGIGVDGDRNDKDSFVLYYSGFR